MDLQQSRRPRIRFLQKQGRKLFVFAQELFDVILHLNTGMDNRPKMSGSDESKKRQDVFAAFAAKGSNGGTGQARANLYRLVEHARAFVDVDERGLELVGATASICPG